MKKILFRAVLCWVVLELRNKCSIICKTRLVMQDKTENFIDKAKKIHGDKYDYSKVNYVNSKTKVCIICPKHGEFWQEPRHHLSKHGCPMCGKENSDRKQSLTLNEFIEKSNQIHNGKYSYDKVNYVNAETKVCIICPKHGEFWQAPHSHLRGQGCPKCGRERNINSIKITNEAFIEKATQIHGGKYDYSKCIYKDSNTKVKIICPIHGEFWQIASSHLNGHGCVKCANIGKLNTISDFIKLSNNKHHGKYDYSRVNYINNATKVCIICPKHGEFWQRPDNHIKGQGCPKCGQITSKAEDEIINILKDFCPQRHNRTLLEGKEIDIYLHNLKLGIEYNGLRWHSEEFGKDHRYHLDKLNECNEQGIRLIQIFEDEWLNHREICESKLKQICGLNTNPKIYGRKCEIHEITDKNEAYEFLDKNHIQGRTGFTVGLGTYYNNELVGVMTFKKEKEGYWDLNRFATDINHQCVGIGGKLFKHFTRNYSFIEIKSFADRRWTTDPTNNLYTKLGFAFDSFVPPSYWYYNPKISKIERFHKFGFRKQHLHKQYGLPLTMTEREMTETLGYTRIWDCGLIKYVYRK